MNRSLDPQWLRRAATSSDAATPLGSRTGVGASLPHESAHLHVAGAAPYVDDLPELAGTLHAALGLSPIAHGRLVAVDRERISSMAGATIAGRSSTTIRSSPTASSTTSASRCSR